MLIEFTPVSIFINNYANEKQALLPVAAVAFDRIAQSPATERDEKRGGVASIKSFNHTEHETFSQVSNYDSKTIFDQLSGALYDTPSNDQMIILDAGAVNRFEEVQQNTDTQSHSLFLQSTEATPSGSIKVSLFEYDTHQTALDIVNSSSSAIVIANNFSAMSVTSTDNDSSTMQVIFANSISSDDGHTPSMVVISDSQVNAVTWPISTVDGLQDNEPCEAETVRILVGDLVSANDDLLSIVVISSGKAYRQMLYNFLSKAFRIGEDKTLLPGQDFITSNLLYLQGLAVDETASINPKDTFEGGMSTANASTYIGSVIPPDISDILRALNASEEFIQGYNTERDRIIEQARCAVGWDDACDEDVCRSFQLCDDGDLPNEQHFEENNTIVIFEWKEVDQRKMEGVSATETDKNSGRPEEKNARFVSSYIKNQITPEFKQNYIVEPMPLREFMDLFNLTHQSIIAVFIYNLLVLTLKPYNKV